MRQHLQFVSTSMISEPASLQCLSELPLIDPEFLQVRCL